jgi:hypothetical protein
MKVLNFRVALLTGKLALLEHIDTCFKFGKMYIKRWAILIFIHFSPVQSFLHMEFI